MKMPQVEDVSSRAPDSRGTLKRTPSGDTHERARVLKTPTSHVIGRSVPVLTPNARTRKDQQIEPADAFLLSRIDGQLQAQELADLTGLSERDVIASLKRLVKAGLVTIA
jgi:hypothetical protein